MVLAGGVAANQGLRETMKQKVEEQLPHSTLIIPSLRLCGDNAAMIAAAGQTEFNKNNLADLSLNACPYYKFLVFPQAIED